MKPDGTFVVARTPATPVLSLLQVRLPALSQYCHSLTAVDLIERKVEEGEYVLCTALGSVPYFHATPLYLRG